MAPPASGCVTDITASQSITDKGSGSRLQSLRPRVANKMSTTSAPALLGGAKRSRRLPQPERERPFGVKGKVTNRKPNRAERTGRLSNRQPAL